jgi:hypothetical protein
MQLEVVSVQQVQIGAELLLLILLWLQRDANINIINQQKLDPCIW